MNPYQYRRAKALIVRTACVVAVVTAVIPLGLVLTYVTVQGIATLARNAYANGLPPLLIEYISNPRGGPMAGGGGLFGIMLLLFAIVLVVVIVRAISCLPEPFLTTS